MPVQATPWNVQVDSHISRPTDSNKIEGVKHYPLRASPDNSKGVQADHQTAYFYSYPTLHTTLNIRILSQMDGFILKPILIIAIQTLWLRKQMPVTVTYRPMNRACVQKCVFLCIQGFALNFFQ